MGRARDCWRSAATKLMIFIGPTSHVRFSKDIHRFTRSH